jgi:hypothetical protein
MASNKFKIFVLQDTLVLSIFFAFIYLLEKIGKFVNILRPLIFLPKFQIHIFFLQIYLYFLQNCFAKSLTVKK